MPVCCTVDVERILRASAVWFLRSHLLDAEVVSSSDDTGMEQWRVISPWPLLLSPAQVCGEVEPGWACEAAVQPAAEERSGCSLQFMERLRSHGGAEEICSYGRLCEHDWVWGQGKAELRCGEECLGIISRCNNRHRLYAH